MVTAKESCQQFSAWNLHELDHKAILQLRQNSSLPHFPHSSVNVGIPGRSISNSPGSKTGQLSRADGFFQQLPPLWATSFPIINLHVKDSQLALPEGLAVRANPVGDSFTSRKKFLIFDQCGNHTRLLFTPSLSPSQNQIVAFSTAGSSHGMFGKEVAVKMEQRSLLKPIVQEKRGENHFTGGSEVHEDTEEINALLYSDSNDEYDDDRENDEVTSTGHTPFAVEEGHDNDKQIGELFEEVATSDGTTKRQKLLDGGYNKKSSLVEAGGLVKMAGTQNYEDELESSSASESNFCDDFDASKRVKKVKIRESLKILEAIIPGSKSSKDPLLIIDKAIIYLKSLNLEAKALGFSYP